MMNRRIFATLTLAAMVAFVAGDALATTVGFVGAGPNNADIPVNYASNVAADGAGWTVSDGTGATPDVTLNWGGGGGSGTGWDWEAHNAVTFQHIEALNAGGAWDATAPPATNAVAQLQDHQIGYIQLQFSVPAGIQFVLNSFDIGNATDQVGGANPEGPYGFDIALIRDSDAATVWSHSTPLWDIEMVPRVPREESVSVGYTGAAGEDYTLRFTRTGGGSIPLRIWRTGLDNLSFSQIPEPTSLALVALCGLGMLMGRNRRWE